MAKQFPPFVQKVVDKFGKSRDFTISFLLHAILVAIFGTTMLYKVVREPEDIIGELAPTTATEQPKLPDTPLNPAPIQPMDPPPSQPLKAITTDAPPQMLDFRILPNESRPPIPAPPQALVQVSLPAPTIGMSKEAAREIGKFTTGWVPPGAPGPGRGLQERVWDFTAFIGQYSGGNWNSTVRVDQRSAPEPGQGVQVTGGSLPNLLYVINKWSKGKIKTNDKQVRAIKLDTDEIFAVRPPFIFLTGTRDFVLTDKEVANLHKYVMLGGAIWGDSSVPGLRSRFDIAFKREMKRVIPDVDKQFEALPDNHPIYTASYWKDIKGVQSGLNFYKLPIYALKIHGEIAILYTANDYGDMWQIGLNEKGEVDTRKTASNQFVAINADLWGARDTYIHNYSPEALVNTYKLGTNVIVHLLTRWEGKVASAPKL